MSNIAFTPIKHSIPLDDYLEFIPETVNVLNFTQSFFQKIQPDSNLRLASDFFKELARENEDRLKSLDLNNKVQILFNAYVESLLPILKKAPKFDNSLKTLKQRFPSETELDSSINRLVFREITDFVTSPLFAINYALGLPYGQVTKPEPEIDSKSDLKVSAKAKYLLKELIGEFACESGADLNSQLQDSFQTHPLSDVITPPKA